MVKDRKNAEYLAKLDRSREQAERGETISFSIDELKEMEKDDWKPTKKIIDFMKKFGWEIAAGNEPED